MNILKVSYQISEYMPSIRQFESTLKFILPIYAILTFEKQGHQNLSETWLKTDPLKQLKAFNLLLEVWA